jgi:hypothetical protein
MNYEFLILNFELRRRGAGDDSIMNYEFLILN